MSDAPRLKPRSGSQKRQRTFRHVGVYDEGENARFVTAYEEWKGSDQARKHGDSEAAFIRYMTIGGGARQVRKGRQRKFHLPAEIDLARLLSQHNQIGNNLNQIARSLNRGREPMFDWIETALKEHRRACLIIAQALGIYV